MSLTKRWIEEQMEIGNDVLHTESQHTDDERQYDEWCHYSDIPSPKAYEPELNEGR